VIFVTQLLSWVGVWMHDLNTTTGTLLEKLTVILLVKKFLAFCVTWRFISVFTRIRHWYLSWAR